TQKAVANLLSELRPCVLGSDATDQSGIDLAMTDLDGTDNLRRIGANAILAVSLAVRCAAARHQEVANSTRRYDDLCCLPLPMFNIVSGGAHAEGAIDLQDVLAIPVGATSVRQAVEWGWRVRTAT